MTIAVVALIVTLVVETLIALLLHRLAWVRAPWSRLRIDVPLVNLMTHPIATLCVGSFGASFTAVEMLVVIAELLAFRYITRLTWGEAVTLAGVANGVTILLSFVG